MPQDGDAPEEDRKRAGEGEGAKPAPKAGKAAKKEAAKCARVPQQPRAFPICLLAKRAPRSVHQPCVHDECVCALCPLHYFLFN